MPLWIRIALRFALTLVLVWAMATYLSDYLFIAGGWKALVTVAALITLMNIFVSPLLDLIVLPLKLVATIVAIVVVNGFFLWLTVWIVDRMDPAIVTMKIDGGIGGWVVIAVVLGLAKWLMKVSLK